MGKQQPNMFYIMIIALSAMIFLPACSPQRRPEDGQPGYEYHQSPLSNVQERDTAEGGAIAIAARELSPSVVGISTRQVSRENLFSGQQTVEGVGSGVIVHSKGYILTNDHVAGGADEIRVILHNGDELEGEVKWSDPTLDLAIVKVEGENLPAARLGESERLLVGETVIAIGTPLGLQFQHTVTAGIISALDRTVQVPTELGRNFMEDLIQTDASINPGNSGGPLINLEGQVIGINTVKVSSAEGIGFAIPIDVAKPIINHFVEDGEFVTPYIGIVGFDKAMASYYKRDSRLEDGVYVVDIDPRGPAYKAGIRVDDVITQINGKRVNKMLGLRTAVYSYHVGDTIRVTVIRAGQEKSFDMTLEEKMDRT